MIGRTLAGLLFATGLIPCWGEDLSIFADVPSGALYSNHVKMLRERLITNGCLAYPQMYCPDYWPNTFTPYYLTRGQAATLVIRSLFSGISGDPELFTETAPPYFTDVPPSHLHYKYIQKLRSLNITNGCTTSEFCPDREISYSEFAVFVYRARQKRIAESESAAVPPPADCTSNPFLDVPSTHPFCPYIREVYNAVGSSAISPECTPPGWPPGFHFCPDVVFNEYQQWTSGLRVKRGTAAFYLVAGVLNAHHPDMLPTSNGELDPVCRAGDPPDCQFSGPAMVNFVTVVGSQLYGYSYTTMSTYSDANFWSFVVEPTLKENTQVKYSTKQAVAGITGPAQVYTPLIPLNPASNYEHPAKHEIASACYGISATSTPYPTLFSANQTVLYRGMSQTVAFRGTTLQGAGAPSARFAYIYNSGTGTSILAPANVSNVSQFGATLAFVTPAATPAGQQTLTLLTEYAPPLGGAGPAVANNPQPVYVADAPPVITSISPSSWSIGATTVFSVSGANFGSNPSVTITGLGLTSYTFTPVNAMLITGTVTVDPNASPSNLTVTVTSNGATGNGFQAPPGVPPQSSAQANVPIVPVILTINMGGANITNSTRSVTIGERVSLSASIISTGIPTSPLPQWTLSGFTIGGWAHSFTSEEAPTSAGPATPVAGLNTTNVSFHWTRGGIGLQVLFSVRLGTGPTYSVVAYFDVAEPIGNLSVSTTSVRVGNYPPAVGVPGLHLQFFSALGPGISFSYLPSFEPSGQFQWVQVVNSSLRRRQSASTLVWERITIPQVLSPMLDHEFPYEIGHSTNDSPGEPLTSGYGEHTRSDTFSMYLMFISSVPNSIHVPLYRVDWFWSGEAGFDGSNWFLRSSSYSTSTTVGIQQYPSYPTWTANVAAYTGPQNWTVEP